MSNEKSVNKLVSTKKPSLKKLDDVKKRSTTSLNSISLDTLDMATQLEKNSISSRAAEIAEQFIKPLENSVVNTIISKNKLLLDKNPFLEQMENVTQKIDCSLNSISLNAVNTAALMKNCSIGPTASEVGAKIIEEMEKKSIISIGSEMVERMKQDREDSIKKLRNQVSFDLNEYAKLISLNNNKLISSTGELIYKNGVGLSSNKTISNSLPDLTPYLEKNSFKNAIKESVYLLKASDLYEAIKENDQIKVTDITNSSDSVFLLLKNLVSWSKMSQNDQIMVLNENKEAIEAELDILRKKNKERVKNATNTRKATSKMNEINAWFRKKENAKINLNSSSITSEAAQLFGVTPQYVNQLKSAYLSTKKK